MSFYMTGAILTVYCHCRMVTYWYNLSDVSCTTEQWTEPTSQPYCTAA